MCRTRKRARDYDPTIDSSEMCFQNNKQMEQWMRVKFPRRAKKKFDRQPK